jgi:hypothetical protein
VTPYLSNGEKRLLVEIETEPEGPDKSGLKGLSDALKKVRKRIRCWMPRVSCA